MIDDLDDQDFYETPPRLNIKSQTFLTFIPL